MQWFLLALWGGALGLWPATRLKTLRWLWAAGLVFAMGVQEALLILEGLWSLSTGLPLHLCGFAGVLSLPLLFWPKNGLYGFIAYLAAPAAFVTLFFPAVMACAHPVLMALAFNQLHVLLSLTPLLLWHMEKPLPQNPRKAFLFGNGYLLLVSAFNQAFQTNYLFLRAAPAGTPLAWLMQNGRAVFIAALEISCMALFPWLKALYERVNRAIAGSR